MSADVVVIGGGIVGCSAAALLAERGVSVTLVEATDIGAGASGRNMGVLQHPFDPVLAPLFVDSLVRYRALAGEAAGFELPDHPSGILLLSADPDEARAQATRLAAAHPELVPAYLEPAAVAEAEPGLAPDLAACRLETGYPIPPAAATAAWARLAEARGVAARIGAWAEPLIASGRVTGVRLADGSVLGAASVLVAAGPWSPPLVDPNGGWQPIRRTWGVTVQVELGPRAPRHIVEEDEVDAVNRPLAIEARAGDSTGDPPSIFTLASAGGRSTLGSTFLPAEPAADHIAPLLVERARRFLPGIELGRTVAVRSCARPQSIDGRPFIGPVAGVEGLFVCAGHGPWGISIGPASAALAVAAMLDGRGVEPSLDAARSA